MNTMTIDIRVKEIELIEACLNQTASGFDIRFPILLFALSERWHINKLIYYLDMIDELKETAVTHGITHNQLNNTGGKNGKDKI